MNQNVEHLLITKFRKQLWRPFSKAIRDYEFSKTYAGITKTRK